MRYGIGTTGLRTASINDNNEVLRSVVRCILSNQGTCSHRNKFMCVPALFSAVSQDQSRSAIIRYRRRDGRCPMLRAFNAQQGEH
jgi:hypothetical protein